MRRAVLLLLMLVGPAGAQVPEQVHVSLADGGGLMVQFATPEPIPPTHAAGVSWRVANGTWQWSPGELAGTGHSASSLASRTFIYAAPVATTQPPGQELEYRVGTRGPGGQETLQEARAITLPPADRLRFVAMGDIGYDGLGTDGIQVDPTAAPARVRALALAQSADLLIVPGDLAYDDSNSGWDRFFRFIEPLAAHMPFMPTLGNHERSNDVEGYRQYLARMVLPGDEQKFLFRAGPVTFITLNSDAICSRGPTRLAATPDPECPTGSGTVDRAVLAWLDDALAEAQADDTPWTIVYFHHQTYSFGRRGDDPALLAHWVPRFEAAGVDVVLAAHDHLYARSHPIHGGAVAGTFEQADLWEYPVGAGPVHVIAGGGGRSLYALRDGPLPDHIAHAESAHHLVVFDIDADTLRMQAIDINGSVIDAFVLQRHAAPSPAVDAAHVPVGTGLTALAVALACRRR